MVLRSSSTTNVNSLAKAIVSQYKEGNKEVSIESVGAAALNQAVKAVAVANGLLSISGKELLLKPNFTMTAEGHTAIILKLLFSVEQKG